MRIGVVTWFGSGNFGTDLQSYALCRYLEKQGHTVKLIPAFKYQELGAKYTIRRFLDHLKHSIRIYLTGTSKQKIRYRIANNYIKKVLPVYQLVTTRQEYKKMMNFFDCFVAGSDQIWNPYHVSSFNLLDFSDSKPCFSYASSIGVEEIPADKFDLYKKCLLKFTSISVREHSGAKALERATGFTNIKTVLDPTFLLTADEWREFSEKDKDFTVPCSDYMLVYTIGSRSNYPSYVNKIREHYKLKRIIVVSSVESNIHYKADFVLDKVSPMAFIKLLLDAKFVCTDSFHATALSINLNKDFIELLRFDDNDKKSQNSRIKDLLGLYELECRIYQGKLTIFPNREINYIDVNKVLGVKRNSSYNYINDLLS